MGSTDNRQIDKSIKNIWYPVVLYAMKRKTDKRC